MKDKIRAIGMVLYAYSQIEDQLEFLWDWIQMLEDWANVPIAEYHFAPKGKSSSRIWKATPENMKKLKQRMKEEQPWFVTQFNSPRGSMQKIPMIEGVHCAISSMYTGDPSLERFPSPSSVSIIVNPDILRQTTNGVSGLIDLGVKAWGNLNAIYGYIDVETGIPLQDHLIRNFDFLAGTLVPTSHKKEFQRWINIRTKLNHRVWKAS